MQKVVLQIDDLRREMLSHFASIREELKLKDKKHYSADDASSYMDIKKSYLFKLTHERKIRFFKPEGKRIYFLKEDLDKYLMRNEYKPRLVESNQETINNRADEILRSLNKGGQS